MPRNDDWFAFCRSTVHGGIVFALWPGNFAGGAVGMIVGRGIGKLCCRDQRLKPRPQVPYFGKVIRDSRT